MKKILSLLLAIMFILSMWGCTEQSQPQETEPVTEVTQTEPAETTLPVELTEPAEEETPSSPILYKATDEEGHVIYLLGSIHVGTEEMYPFPDYLTDAYAQSDALAVECDVVSAQKDLALSIRTAKAMVLSDGSKVSDYVPRSCYKRAVEILKENNTYNEAMDYYMPVMWYSLISSLATDKAGTSADLGVDMYFLTDALENDKTVYEIESIEAQYAMLAGMSMDLQSLLLEEVVNTYGNPQYNIYLRLMCRAWADGDADGILEQSSTEGLPPEQQALIEEFNNAMEGQRNILMTDYAKQALASGETVFIVVGAAHVLGDDGIAANLAAEGYTVEQVTNNE